MRLSFLFCWGNSRGEVGESCNWLSPSGQSFRVSHLHTRQAETMYQSPAPPHWFTWRHLDGYSTTPSASPPFGARPPYQCYRQHVCIPDKGREARTWLDVFQSSLFRRRDPPVLGPASLFPPFPAGEIRRHSSQSGGDSFGNNVF